MTRKGKIARLPRDVREELNRRMDNGEPGTDLVPWLNGLPKVKRVLKEHFGGREITEQNLSEWKTGGHLDWLAQEEQADQAKDYVASAEKLAKSIDSPVLADHLARVLLMRYTEVLADWKGPVTPEFRRQLEALRALRKDVLALRRSGQDDLRMEMAQQRFEWDRERFDWEAAKAGDDSLERESARDDKMREKRRHWEAMVELGKKLSEPPPAEGGGEKAESGKAESEKAKGR